MKRCFFCFALIIPLFLMGCENSSSSETTIQSSSNTSIEEDAEELTIENYKTDFFIYEKFDSSSLKASFHKKDGTDIDVTDSVSIDSSNFVFDKVGRYEISVTYNNFSEKYFVNVNARKTLKVLMIGNSFSEDATTFANEIASGLGMNMENTLFATVIFSGCSIEQHLSFARSESKNYTYVSYDGDKLTRENNYSLRDALEQEDWDIITFQQNSAGCGNPDTYSMLSSLLRYVKNIVDEKVLFAWHMTWSFDQSLAHLDSRFDYYNNDEQTMYNAIISTTLSKVCEENKIDIIIPAATAIDNCRSANVFDSLNRDGYHLSLDYGRYLAGLTLVSKLSGINPEEEKYFAPGVDRKYIDLLASSVNQAILKPFEITLIEE